jgi:hypothetical protein
MTATIKQLPEEGESGSAHCVTRSGVAWHRIHSEAVGDLAFINATSPSAPRVSASRRDETCH